MNVKLLTKDHLELLSLKGGCTGSSESTLVKMSHCWKSQAHLVLSRADIGYPGFELGPESRQKRLLPPGQLGRSDSQIMRCYSTKLQHFSASIEAN